MYNDLAKHVERISR